MPVTKRYGLPFDLGKALIRLDALIMGGWGPRLAGMVQASRTFAYHGGYAYSGGAAAEQADGTIVITDDATRYVQRTPGGTVSQDAALDLVNKLPMAKVVTASGEIVSFKDIRDLGFLNGAAVLANLYSGDAGDQIISDGDGPVAVGVGAAPDGYVWTLVDGLPDWAAPEGGGGSESLLAKTILQMHMDGADASTTFTDVMGHTVTPSGNAQIDTAESKFGGACALFDGTGDYLTVTAHKDFNLPNAFTIDFWIKTAQNTRQYATVLERDNGTFTAGSWSILFNEASASDGKIYFAHHSYVSAGTRVVHSTTAINDNVWHHIAVIGIGNTFFMFVDGVLEDQQSFNQAPAVNSAALLIGKSVNATREFAGWLDELRIIKGAAAWTKDFTPPSSAYADV